MGATSINAAVVDNWMLELAVCALDPSWREGVLWNQRILQRVPMARDSISEKWAHYPTATDAVLSLLQLIDLIVLHDELLHGEDFGLAWKRLGHLSALDEVLRPVSLPNNSSLGMAPRATHQEREAGSSVSPVVADGALRYLELARGLGVAYWPSPKRAIFLADLSGPKNHDSFLMSFMDSVNVSLREMIDSSLAEVRRASPPLFPGFGSIVLRECDSPASIVQAAVQYRQSKEASKLRRWIAQMENAWAAPDVEALNRWLVDLRKIIKETRTSFVASCESEVDVTLQIGLSPSLTIGEKALAAMSQWFKPKPFHVTFIRRHFHRVLRAPDILKDIVRLFPEFRDTSPFAHSEHRRLTT